MEPDFWHSRWDAGRIGFHQASVSPLLIAHWATLEIADDARVFVPLCGKSLDLSWLANRGHRVLGVELSQRAVEQFFDEHRLVPQCRVSTCGTHYVAGDIELICGDVFALDRAALADCDGVFDRAALIALPPPMRIPYLRDVYARLPDTCRGLAITLEYPQVEKAGPPFSVEEEEVRSLLEPHWSIDMLERRDILSREPGFVADGVTGLSTVVYAMRKTTTAL